MGGLGGKGALMGDKRDSLLVDECACVCKTERDRQSVGIVEMMPASLPFGAILCRRESQARGSRRFTSPLCCHLFQCHCPMATSLICPITEEDYDVFVSCPWAPWPHLTHVLSREVSSIL